VARGPDICCVARYQSLFFASRQKVLAEKGSDNASIDDFIAKTGLAKGTFYNHFQTPEEILTAVATDSRKSSPYISSN